MTPRMIPSSGAKNPYLDAWLPVSLQSPALFSALLFSTLTHKLTLCLVNDTLTPAAIERDRQSILLCQQDAATMTNLTLKHAATALTDASILAVLMLTEAVSTPQDRDWRGSSPFNAPLQGLQWLNVHGSRVPHLSHQAGLCKLVALRGGLQNISIPGASLAIFYRTLVNSTLTLTKPQIPFYSAGGHGNSDWRFYFSLPEGCFDQGVLEFAKVGLPFSLACVFQGSVMYSSMVHAYVNGDHAPHHTSLLCDIRNLVHFHVMSLRPGDEFEDSKCYPLYEACRLALMIYSVGVIFPIPPVGSPLPLLALRLREELCTSSYFEKDASEADDGLLAWIIVMGGIAALGTEERPWFAQRLASVANAISASSWSILRAQLKLFPWLACACDNAGERLWEEAHHIDLDPATDTPGSHRYTTRPQPCVHCSRRRVRCDKTRPCRNCVKHGLTCEYKPSRLGEGRETPTTAKTQVCRQCRQRKVKCNGQRPCQACQNMRVSCSNEDAIDYEPN
ncbi:Zn(II)2Cys6 transcription factor domain-containing protein [Aspergillus saccharolyticus JOP 1030-1]|uniref:Zn(2)-C6 fungal-type domain-containing protein n=1 Tax=Aspergillus saccharolyticus JOP 1030-1 TaxID=1450539 RepID=A0A318ZH69_9EURO|nr:hypothetical protein BP01DRAFT_401890 [Aspergillus saccharolyticus JOP 1030-1]PYH43923.1 hypothetical protein BP01DRAFT_401890 [Aspergillus saccharolyticus JOP 1030-1]